MKKFFTLSNYFILICLNLFIASNLVMAVVEIQNPLKYKSLQELVGAFITFIRNVALIFFPITIIVAGYQFMTSAGDPKKVEEARQTLWYAFVGLMIILAAQAILAAIKATFGLEGSSPPKGK